MIFFSKKFIPLFFQAMIMLGIIGIFCIGCQTERRQLVHFKEDTLTPSYMPTNFTLTPIPDRVISLAVLPLSTDLMQGDQKKAFDQILLQEIGKTNLFEVIPVTSLQAQEWFQQESLSRYKAFPNNALETLHKKTSADALLLGEIIEYHPYSPIRLGLKLAIVEVGTGQVLWSFEDTFDAGLITVAYGAERYSEVALKAPYPFSEAQTMAISPRMFFQYASYQAFKSIYRPAPLS